MNPAITHAIEFLRDRNYPIPPESMAIIKNGGFTLKPVEIRELAKSIRAGKLLAKETKALNYNAVRQTMWAEIYDAVWGYLNDGGSIVSARNTMKKAVADAWVQAADIAYEDGGGTLPVDEDTLASVEADQSAQLSYVDALFQNLKGLRKEGDFDAIDEAFARANGYADSLDGLYNYVKAAAAGNKMLTFDGQDGSPDAICQSIGGTCVKLMGQRHRASWWISHDLIPYPGNKNYDCGAWKCEHYLRDDNGDKFTV